MGFDDRPANGKSYSRPLGFCCKEGLKDTVFIFIIYSCPGVLNGDQNSRRVLNEIGPYPQQAHTIGDRAHGFDCV